MQWFAIVLVGFLAALLSLTPRLSRPTVPLGVSVPSDRIDDPVVRHGIRTFHLAVVMATIATVVVVVALWSRPQLTVSVAPILVLSGGVVAFVVCRRPIMAAKDAGSWYDGQPVRVQAGVGAAGEPAYRPRWIPSSAAIALVRPPLRQCVIRRCPSHPHAFRLCGGGRPVLRQVRTDSLRPVVRGSRHRSVAGRTSCWVAPRSQRRRCPSPSSC